MKKNIHIISHSHWDREWYMPFEHHRARLVDLIDDCIELFETDLDFKSFHLDGHTALLEDYLEIKPQNKDKLKKYISEGRFFVGPWYVLQDEFLTSSEANVRNLLFGMELAKEFGNVCKVGYFPDSFGNAGQMPQLMKQAGMKAIAFGRGVKPTGTNNTVSDDEYNSQFSELYWKSPDGSIMPAILFANWYNNGCLIPEDGDCEYWDKKISDCEKYASCDELLMMNGSDHMPVQKNLSVAIKTAKEKYPDYNFIHSDFMTYVDAVVKKVPENLAVVEGELINQNTQGWYTLLNTASGHQNLKLLNRKSEIALESQAEPLAAMASMYGMEHPDDLMRYAWKTLMKNHPHDSICGCSCDEVNEEVKIRFKKCMQVAEVIKNKSLNYLCDRIDTSCFEECVATIAVFNTYGLEKSSLQEIDIDLSREYRPETFNDTTAKIELKKFEDEYELIDADGNVYPCKVNNLRPRFGYDLPHDDFRKPYIAETVTVTFEACNIPAVGYKVFGVRKKTQNISGERILVDKNKMENEFMSVSVRENGTIDLKDKKTGNVYEGLLRYEDVGDLGTEYTFLPVDKESPILSGDEKAKIEIIRDEEFAAEIKITTVMNIPKSGDEELQHEKMMFFKGLGERKGGRSKELVAIEISTYLLLEKHSKSLKIRTEFENTANDHRLRVLIPTGIKGDKHKVGSVFEAAVRENSHKECWTYPSDCERQQEFLLMQDELRGIAVANIGIYEYEILKDNSIALTLVRAVGEMGDWGIFPTELSQCREKLSLEYEIIPFEKESDALKIACSKQYPLTAIQCKNLEVGMVKDNHISWIGEHLRMTAFKKANSGEGYIVRWVNYSNEEQKLEIKSCDTIEKLYQSNILEEKKEEISKENDGWSIDVKPCEILTLRMK